MTELLREMLICFRLLSPEEQERARVELVKLQKGNAGRLEDPEAVRIRNVLVQACRDMGVRSARSAPRAITARRRAGAAVAGFLKEHGPASVRERIGMAAAMAEYEVRRIREYSRMVSEYQVMGALQDPRAVAEELWPGYLEAGILGKMAAAR